MITKMTLEEKQIMSDMISGLAKRWGKRLNVSVEALSEILDNTTVEVYQEYPFTTAIVKKTVSGKHIRGAGFMKYNLNDAKIAKTRPAYAWNEQKGKIDSINNAFHSFIKAMVAEDVLKSMPEFKKVEEVAAPVEVPAEVVSKSQQKRLDVQAFVEPTEEVLVEVRA